MFTRLTLLQQWSLSYDYNVSLEEVLRRGLIILFVLFNVVFFTVSSSYGSETHYTGDGSSNEALSPMEGKNSVELIVSTIPAVLRMGEQGYLQVQLIPNTTIASAMLQVTSGSDALQITPESVVLTNLVPPTPGSAPGKSPPDPPALGVVPLVNFHVKVLRAGVFPATIEFRTDRGVQKLQILIKGAYIK